MKVAKCVHDALEAKRAKQQIKDKHDMLEAQLRVLETYAPKCAKSEDHHEGATKVQREVINEWMPRVQGALTRQAKAVLELQT